MSAQPVLQVKEPINTTTILRRLHVLQPVTSKGSADPLAMPHWLAGIPALRWLLVSSLPSLCVACLQALVIQQTVQPLKVSSLCTTGHKMHAMAAVTTVQVIPVPLEMPATLSHAPTTAPAPVPGTSAASLEATEEPLAAPHTPHLSSCS